MGAESIWSVVELSLDFVAALVLFSLPLVSIFWWWDQNFFSSRSWDLGTDEMPGNCLWTQAEPPVLGTRETSHVVKLGYLRFGPLESSLCSPIPLSLLSELCKIYFNLDALPLSILKGTFPPLVKSRMLWRRLVLVLLPFLQTLLEHLWCPACPECFWWIHLCCPALPKSLLPF